MTIRMRDVIPASEHRYWKKDFLSTYVSTNILRKEYCKQQTLLGRKDTHKIYEEARRKFK
jgi:hypothetical protein